MQIVIYQAVSPSGKSYIGITSKSLKRRITQHLCSAKLGSDYKFHKALRKYGPTIKCLNKKKSFKSVHGYTFEWGSI